MFPQITKNKKKLKIGTDEMIKECQDVMKQIQFKHKKAIKVLPAQLVSDFHKVCRLKDINPFYGQYFFYFIQKAPSQNLQQYFTEQVDLTTKKYKAYQKRELIQQMHQNNNQQILQLSQQVVEGFSIMNSGKNLPISLKGMINGLIKDCSSLQQVKAIQTNQITKLAECIMKVRQNLKQIAQMLISWQYQLRSFVGQNQPTSFKKMKVIYPQNGINCVFVGLFDTSFIKSSFLSQQIKFLNVQYDPFLKYFQQTKKTSRIIKQNFIQFLQSKASNFAKVEGYILDIIPKKPKKENQQKQLKRAAKSQKKFYSLQKTKSKQRKRLQKKIKDEYLNSKLITQTNEQRQKIQDVKKRISIDKIAGAYKKKKKSKASIYKDDNLQRSLSKSRSLESLQGRGSRVKSVIILQEREVTVSSSDNRSKKSIGSIDKNKAMSKTMTNMNMKKIQNVYKLSKNSSIGKSSPRQKVNKPQIDIDNVLKDKQQLMKQLNKQKKQQQTLKKIIKKVQNRTDSENKLYDKKMKEYEKQIDLLKSRIQQRQKKFQRSPKAQNYQYNKNNQLITKIYQKRSNNNESPNKYRDDLEYNIASSRLLQQKNTNKMLQNKIKQLMKEKIKLQKLIQTQGTKINKQKEMYQRKLQKYQQIINKLKNQSNQNQNKALQFKKKFSLGNNNTQNVSITIRNNQKFKNRQDQFMKLYSKRQTIGGEKERKSPQKKRNDSKSKQDSTQKAQKGSQSQVEKKSQKKSQKDKQIKQDLKITNNQNTIQIVYNPKKNKKSKRSQQPEINNSQLKQKQYEYQKNMTQLQKQKSLLERKLELRMNEKSGTEMVLMRKLQQSQQQLQKYREMIQKSKQTNVRSDERMRQLRKKINQEYEQKMQRQRRRFQDQRQILYYKLKQERQSKMQKDKYLSKQMIFLKQMQMRQDELISMLQMQRKQRQERQRLLQQQIIKKQQVLQEYQLQQIKRIIQKQVRQQMNLINGIEEQQQDKDEDQKARQYELKKQAIQNQIKQMMAANDYQLQQIDEENLKLKQLINKIKQQEHQIIANLQTNIWNDQKEENQELHQLKNVNQNYNNSRLNNQQQHNQSINKSRISHHQHNKLDTYASKFQSKQFIHNRQKSPQQNDQIAKQLHFKSELQLQRQKLSHSRYKQLQQSPNYKERQKIQNIIEHYLRNPHQYPSNKSIVMKPQQQNQLVQDLTLKSKKAKQFEQQLMDLKNVQSFVPAQRDDPITTHMLNLRQAYQNQQAESLRRILFPAINQQQRYDEDGNELSFESQQPPPPVSIRDHVKIHQQNYINEKKERKLGKNFMAINRMKLLQIQQQKKQKHRVQIQEQTRKKVRKQLYKIKKREQKEQKEFIQIKKQLQQKQKRRQIQLEKAKKGVQENQIKNDKNKQRQKSIIKKKKQQKQKQIQNKSEQDKQDNQFLIPNVDSNKQLNKKVNKQDKDKTNKTKIDKKANEKSDNKIYKKDDKKQTKKQTKQKTIDKKQQNKQELKNKQVNKQKEQQTKKQQEIKQQTINKQVNQQKNKQQSKNQSKQQQQEQNQFLFLQNQQPDNQPKLVSQVKDLKNQTQINNKDQQHIEKPKVQTISQINDKNYQIIQTQKKDQNQNQKDNKDQQEQNYDQQFQNLSEQQQNQFIPPQNQTLKQLKQKLNQLDPKHKTQQQQNHQLNNQKDKQIQKEQDQKKQIQQNKQQKQQVQQIPNSQNIALLLLQKERSSLKQDLLSYQQEIRSYISSYSQFQVYQHYVVQKELIHYIDQILQLSSQEIIRLNNNLTLKKDILSAESVLILIAKDKQTKLQIGIGVFHKQFQNSQYVCGFLLAHDMKNFLNLTFNFSRFIYQHDSFCHSVQFIFTISALQDQVNKNHFIDFQNKCKRLGQIYVKGKQSATRKYVLKRNLFQYIDNQQTFTQQKGIVFQNKIQIHQNLMKQKNQGFINQVNQNHCSSTVLLSLYLKNNPQQLIAFKKKNQDDLKNRQTLVTAMVFAKKDFILKSAQNRILDTQQKISLYNNVLGNIFNVEDLQQQVQQLSFSLSEVPPKRFKRCILQMNEISQPYCFVQFQQPLNRVQTANSAQIGTFIPLIPKFKVLIIPAQQYLTSCSSNPDMNVFFYTKHFIKNITEVKKQTINRVYLPEIKKENWTFYRDVSEKFKKTVFGRQKIQLGFESKIANSVIFTPKHSDLVIEKPFIISVLSANIERVIQGSPIFCKLIQ